MVRGDFNKVTIGPGTNVQDLAVVKVTSSLPAPTSWTFASDLIPLTRSDASTMRGQTTEGSEATIGSQVTIGHSAILVGCTVGDQSLIGIKSIVSEGATVESMAMVAPGAVVPAGTTVVSKQLWGGSPAKYIRDLTVRVPPSFFVLRVTLLTQFHACRPYLTERRASPAGEASDSLLGARIDPLRDFLVIFLGR